MACLLAIETSTKVCSVNLSKDGATVFNQLHDGDVSHASLLGVFVADAMKAARRANLTLDAVAVSAGPGSYTGLRIGVSEAKGLCYGLGIPMIALPTLKILAQQVGGESYLVPMLDARRMEVYSAIYDKDLNEVRGVEAEIIEETSYQEYLNDRPVVFFGNGSDKCRGIIQSPNAHFLDNIVPTAEAMIPLAEQAFARKDFVDVAYFEPFYLKEFQATVAKSRL